MSVVDFPTGKPKSSVSLNIGGKTVAFLVALVVLYIVATGSTATVNAGFVGVVATFGRVEPIVLQPGIHFVVPIAQKVYPVDTRVHAHDFKEIEAASLEMQTVRLTGVMNYHLEPSRAADLYQNVGLDFADKVIDPAFNDFIKEVVPQYPVTQILARRDEVRTKAKEALSANLERYGIIVDDIYVSNIAFSQEYQQAIERKQTAQQNVEVEQQVLAQKQIQAQQKLVDTKAEADSSVLRADGEAKAEVVRAEAGAKAETLRADGEAKANNLRESSITPQLIEYLRWTRWDGQLPMVTGESNPLIQINPKAETGR